MVGIIRFIFKATGVLLILVVAMSAAFLWFAPVIGGSPDSASTALIAQSPNYNGKKFVNTIATSVSTPDNEESMDLWGMISPRDGKIPSEPMPSGVFNKNTFSNGDLVWFGHSTVLLKTEDVTVLTDPIFYNASPIPFTIQPFPVSNKISIQDLPPIDVVIISHDHYDHLDYRAIVEIDSMVERYLVPLGVKAHLQRWGVANYKIKEMDWYDSTTHNSISFTMAPARHFSGRSFKRSTTLWGSWIVRSGSLNIYFSGDSGYFDEFAEIGDRFGPFDFAFVENGAYNLNWTQIHMMPEESVQAAIDLQSKVFFPVHWGKFDLSSHTWDEPIKRAKAAAERLGLNLATPLIGEVFTATDYPVAEWWLTVE
jgi:L-ascorbate metabolism protein UlaG (beta-lactamase superfamily)